MQPGTGCAALLLAAAGSESAWSNVADQAF
jgi:hypothetical protein